MKIYTKTGDSGTTGLFGGGRVSKDHLRVEAYGTVDELNSQIGVVLAQAPSGQMAEWLHVIQNQLFHLGADLATPLDAKADWIVRVDAGMVSWLEAGIDEMTDQLEPLKHFILPGGCMAASHLHVARTICRRAERCAVTLKEAENIGEYPAQFLNRLSDWLFTAARYENMLAGISEEEWALR